MQNCLLENSISGFLLGHLTPLCILEVSQHTLLQAEPPASGGHNLTLDTGLGERTVGITVATTHLLAEYFCAVNNLGKCSR